MRFQTKVKQDKPSGGPGTARFPRAARLLARTEFLRVYDHGRKQFSRSFTFFYLLHDTQKAAETMSGGRSAHVFRAGDVRFGLTVGRVLGNSVHRNRIKRRTRDLLRKERGTIATSLMARNLAADIVVHPKKSVFDADYAPLATEIEKGLSSIAEAAL
jgi:ribonuclease P protein component